MRKLTLSFVFTVALVLASCASAKGKAATKQSDTHLSTSLITRAELDRFPSSSAYEIIQELHPQWLIGRGQKVFRNGAAPVQVSVYLGATELGGPDELRNFQASQLASIQFLDARLATLRFGAGHLNGAIVLTQR